MANNRKGKHRMKRPQPADAKHGRLVDDIKDAYTTEQLAEVGAIALAWNQIDTFIDFMLLVVLKMPVGLWLEVAKRINGMDGKLAILRKRAEQSVILTDEARACIKSALDAVAEYKTYRDAIIHSLMFDIDKGIAHRIGSRAEIHQVLVTTEALSALFKRLALIRVELRQIDLLFRLEMKMAQLRSIAALSIHLDCDAKEMFQSWSLKSNNIRTIGYLCRRFQNFHRKRIAKLRWSICNSSRNLWTSWKIKARAEV